MIWVINTNTNTCNIYDYQKKPIKLTLLKEILHPENKLKKSEFLTSDKPGRYKTDYSNGGAYSPRTDPKEVEIDNFAREIMKELDHGRNNHSYKELILIAPPHMSGVLLQHADKHVKDFIVSHFQKDFLHLSEHELLAFLQTHAKYHDKTSHG